MNHFGRAIRLALVYRWTLAGVVFSSLAIAVLWGGNIGAIYPFVEIAFEGKSLHVWADERIAESRRTIEASEAELKRLTSDDNSSVTLARRANVAEQRARAEAALAQTAWIKAQVIEPYLPDDAFQSLVVIVGLLILGTFIKSAFTVANSVWVGRLSQLVGLRLRMLFYRRTLEMDLAQFTADGAGDLMNRFTSDIESVSSGLNELFGKLVREPLKMAACMIGAAWICWRLLVISLILAPVAGILIRWLARTLKRANRRAMEEMSQLYGILDETFGGMKVVKAFTMERYERRRFHNSCKKYYFKFMRIIRYDALSRPLTELLGMAIISVAMLAGAYLAINRQTHLFGLRISYEPLNLSSLLLFYGLLAGMADPARKLSEIFSRLQRGAAAADRIYYYIDREPAILDPPRPQPLPRHQRELALENVSFAYVPGQLVLENIDLRIRGGETIALVGPNGCGKTTLANLISRFIDPTAGRVTIDGIDVRDVRMRDLRAQIGLVAQETLLFNDTVFNNIRYGAADATRDEVLAAAERAHAHRFITERLSDGYETEVGPRGSSLSGGQRQRIALARAILRNPSILVLDEATSQVDLESEQLIHRVLEEFTRQRTTIIVTHRLGILALADRIVVMNAGRIEDVGMHDELVRRCDLYRRLHQSSLRESA